MGKYVVKNYPSPRLMKTIGATNQSVPEAIGELVANCFDARIENNKVNVLIDLRGDEIKVIDDGRGMTINVLEKAVCIAEDMSKYIERGEKAKGHFGMGFKTSCSTLGHFYEIFTKPASNVEYHVSFNIDEYSSRPTNADAWDVEIEDSLSFDDSPLKDYSHGTAFVIKNLKDQKIYFGAIYDYIGEAFKGHLESGDSIKFIDENGEKIDAIPKIYSFINGTKINIDEIVEFVEDDGTKTKNRIKGWMALDKITHNNGNYGFNIYRNNQLLEKWNKEWFPAHLMTSRIIGEVSMDFLESTFYKQGTQQSIKWIVASTHMKEYLKPIVNASRDISRKGNVSSPSETRRIVKKLNDEYETGYDVQSTNNDFVEDTNNIIKNYEVKKVTDNIKNYVKEKSLILDGFGEMTISYIENENEIGIPFDYIFSEDQENEGMSELQVIVFKNHPLWEKKIDTEIKKTLVTSDAIYRVLVEKLNYKASEALEIRNTWINKRLEK